ncbi:MAG: hypothetical protein M5U34_01030 [Chloroflexi bacterium]|nr:hypothetical protein [Chloroflexota bacterium]
MSQVAVGGNTTTFSYDTDGSRVQTTEPGGKTTFYPFPGIRSANKFFRLVKEGILWKNGRFYS